MAQKKGDPKDFAQKLARAREMVQINGHYRHRQSGGLYKVTNIVMREEDTTPAVIYESVDGAPIPWDRKLPIFLEKFYRVEFSVPPPEAKD